MVAEVDPLRDSSYEFAHRLARIGKDVKLILLRDYMHGFNNFDCAGGGIEEYRNATNKTEQIFKELLDIQEGEIKLI
jgi:acetyl esterase/lipase